MKSGMAGIAAAVALSAGLSWGDAAAQQAQPSAPDQAYCSSSITPYLNSVFLAYIKSSQDSVTEAGLNALAERVAERTSLEESVKNKSIKTVGIDIENDDICFFPFIYWPVTADSAPLTAQAQWKVQTYLSRGGFIMFDIRDAGVEWKDTLKTLMGNVNLGALEPIEDDHILRNTFYKNSNLPGSINLGSVYVQAPLRKASDKVSQVIAGERNWASAWAGMTLRPGTPEHEQAMRAGINIVVYAFTGNYKGDQFNMEKTLDHLGR